MPVILLLLAAGQTALPTEAERLAVSGSVRLRYETIDDQPRAGFDRSDALVDVRTTLAAEYRGEGWRIGGELFDSRAYGADRGTPLSTNEVNALELVQAYAGTDVRLGKHATLAVQAGRFTLNLGARRLVAADDYRNTTNGYTGLRADLTAKGGVRATAIYVLPQVRLPDDFTALRDNRIAWDRESFDLVLWGGIASRARTIVGAALEASFFHLGERDAPARPTRDRSLDTIGLRLVREPAPARADFELEGFRQRGQISGSSAAGAATLGVSAWFVHADAGYTFAGGWKPRVSIEFDAASGDRPGGRYGRFDTLFGMRRAELAPAGLYNAVGRANLVSPGVRIEAVPSPRLDGFVSVRPIWLEAATDAFSTTGVRDAAGRAGRYAGTQIDSRLRWWLVPQKLRAEVNAVLLAKGRFLRNAPNAPAGSFTRYLSWNLTTNF